MNSFIRVSLHLIHFFKTNLMYPSIQLVIVPAQLMLFRVVLHYAVVLDRLLDIFLLLQHLPAHPRPSLCCVRSLPSSVDLRRAPYY